VHGDRDEFGQVDHLRALVARLPEEARARLEIISNADHFFEGRLDEMKRVITEWIKERMIADCGLRNGEPQGESSDL